MKNIFLTLAMAIPAFSQSSIKDALVKHWKVTGDFTIAVANAMPADKYNFRPVPAEMSFGQVIAHIANADLGACATASGMQRPTIPAKVTDAAKDQKVEVDKDTAVQFLTDTVNFCNQAVASMTPEKLDAVVGTTRK